MVEHKRALWDRYLCDETEFGREEAGRRWRESYYWALKRLYFCSRCPQCKWGDPFFDGPHPDTPRQLTLYEQGGPQELLDERHARFVADVMAGTAWNIEVAYARRGGFSILDRPRLIKQGAGGFLHLVFPTNARLIQSGTLVALSVAYEAAAHEVIYAHCLCAGPEAEIQFFGGRTSLGLPPLVTGDHERRAEAEYVTWRRKAWSDFWADELEQGIAAASAAWIRAFWEAMERLFGGNELAGDGWRSSTEVVL